jgi:hypothetical protein
MTQEEVVFLSNDAAKVTSARVIVGGSTFAMAGVTSVEARKIFPKTSYLPGLLAVMFGLMVMATPDSIKVGAVILAFGVLWIWSEIRKPIKYALIIRAAGGEVNALESEKENDIDVIALAITDAIVHRG